MSTAYLNLKDFFGIKFFFVYRRTFCEVRKVHIIYTFHNNSIIFLLVQMLHQELDR